jgi:hypothetical protein
VEDEHDPKRLRDGLQEIAHERASLRGGGTLVEVVGVDAETPERAEDVVERAPVDVLEHRTRRNLAGREPIAARKGGRLSR